MNTTNSSADEEQTTKSWQPDVLVLGPGGAKGFAILGALQVLTQETTLLSNVTKVIGVSVGAIIGFLFTLGVPITSILVEAIELSVFRSFLEDFTIRNVRSNGGAVSNRPIRELLTRHVEEKFGRGRQQVTFQQVLEETGKTFVAVSVNVDQYKVEYFSSRTHPDMDVVQAVLMSINIPLFFYKIEYEGCTYVDGALGNPYPVDLFDDRHHLILGVSVVEPLLRSNNPSNPSSLSSPTPTNNNANNNDLTVDQAKREDLSFTSYLYRALNSVIRQLKNHIIRHSSNNVKHLFLPVSVQDTTGVSLQSEDKANLFRQGQQHARSFVHQELLHNTSATARSAPTASAAGLSE